MHTGERDSLEEEHFHAGLAFAADDVGLKEELGREVLGEGSDDGRLAPEEIQAKCEGDARECKVDAG